MDQVLVLLAVSVTATLAAPLLVGEARWQIHRPQLALFAWLAVFTLGVLTLGSAVMLAIGVSTGLVPHQDDHHTPWDHTVLALGAWVALGLVGAILVVVARGFDRIRAERLLVDEAVTSVSDGATAYDGDHEYVIVPSPEPSAFSIPGPEPTVAVTQGLVDTVTSAELSAVLAHERAHLRYRHGAIIALADLNAACVPWLSAARRFAASARLLIELIADDVAVRQVGAADLISALSHPSIARTDPAAQLRAVRLSRRNPARQSRQSR